jgi:hypothetical protein
MGAVWTALTSPANLTGAFPFSAVGPMAVDHQIRGAISLCWLLLPPEKRTPEIITQELRRMLERALANLTEDARVFGQPDQAEGA